MSYKSVAMLLMFILSACAAVPLKPDVGSRAVDIETLQGSVAVALDSKSGKMSGHGVLFFQRPDQFRLSVLSPFGQILMDIIVKGDDILYLMPSQKKGWAGTGGDLPDSLGMRIWPLMAWVVETPRIAGPAVVREFKRADGSSETVYFDGAGLVKKKTNSSGDEVSYGDYRRTQGGAMANVVEIASGEGSRLKLTFDEPEVNIPIEKEVMTPNLNGIELLPLAAFSGF